MCQTLEVFERFGGNFGTPAELIVASASNRASGCQLIAFVECTAAYLGHSSRNADTSQIAALIKCIASNIGDSFRHNDRLNHRIPLEYIRTNRHYRVTINYAGNIEGSITPRVTCDSRIIIIVQRIKVSRCACIDLRRISRIGRDRIRRCFLKVLIQRRSVVRFYVLIRSRFCWNFGIIHRLRQFSCVYTQLYRQHSNDDSQR